MGISIANMASSAAATTAGSSVLLQVGKRAMRMAGTQQMIAAKRSRCRVGCNVTGCLHCRRSFQHFSISMPDGSSDTASCGSYYLTAGHGPGEFSCNYTISCDLYEE